MFISFYKLNFNINLLNKGHGTRMFRIIRMCKSFYGALWIQILPEKDKETRKSVCVEERNEKEVGDLSS